MASNFSGWAEVILLLFCTVNVYGLIIADLNNNYGQNNVVPFTDSAGVEGLFISYQNTSQTGVIGGDVDFSAEQGLTLKSSFSLIKNALTIIWSFISGGGIEEIINSFGLGLPGAALAKALRVLYFLGLVWFVIGLGSRSGGSL